jgi:NADH-ubiquinone oxidoreductase chain 6
MYFNFVFFDLVTNGLTPEILDFLSLISILFGIFIIISKNPIVSVLYLIGLFATISIYLIFLGLNFIGLAYLLVYVGAVSILFLFILMLINIRISELLSDTNNSIPLAIIITIVFVYPINRILPSNNFDYSFLNNIKNISFATSKNWDGTLTDASHITSIGNIMYTSYSIWLIITSIILLLAMVGAIVITLKQPSK